MKAKLKIVIEVEYPLIPSSYPEGSTPEQMVEMDVQQTDEDPFIIITGENATWTITGEVING